MAIALTLSTKQSRSFEKLRGLGIPIDGSPEITVQNSVTSADFGESLNLNAIAIGTRLYTSIIGYSRAAGSSVFSRSGDDQLVCVSGLTTDSPGSHTRPTSSAGSIDMVAIVSHCSQQLYPSLGAFLYRYIG